MWSMATPRHSTITPAGRGSRMIRLGRVLDRFDSGYEVSAVKLPADLAEFGWEPLRFCALEDALSE
jgi:hypothetical protein